MKDYVAHAERTIASPIERVWLGLTTTETHAAMMFGSIVETDWQPGSRILWRGEWEGKPFEDHGEITAAEAPHRLVFTHFSPLSGETDTPEHQHTIALTLETVEGGTRVELAQDNNPTTESAEHSAGNWSMALDLLDQAIIA